MIQNPLWGYIFHPKSDERSLVEMLSSLPIFDGLTRGQLKQITRLLHQREYDKDEIVFNQSEPGAGLYIIVSGRITIWRPIEGAEPMVLAEFVEGNFFGELALVDEIPRSATASAVERTTLLAFPKPDLERLIDRQPQVAVKILFNLSRLIAQRLVRANENLERLSQAAPSDT